MRCLSHAANITVTGETIPPSIPQVLPQTSPSIPQVLLQAWGSKAAVLESSHKFVFLPFEPHGIEDFGEFETNILFETNHLIAMHELPRAQILKHALCRHVT